MLPIKNRQNGLEATQNGWKVLPKQEVYEFWRLSQMTMEDGFSMEILPVLLRGPKATPGWDRAVWIGSYTAISTSCAAGEGEVGAIRALVVSRSRY